MGNLAVFETMKIRQKGIEDMCCLPIDKVGKWCYITHEITR